MLNDYIEEWEIKQWFTACEIAPFASEKWEPEGFNLNGKRYMRVGDDGNDVFFMSHDIYIFRKRIDFTYKEYEILFEGLV